jgi:two-component system sensor histidine kinase DctS
MPAPRNAEGVPRDWRSTGPQATPTPRDARVGQWLLWGVTLFLLLALVGTAMVLARRFQETRVQQMLEVEAASLVSDIRAGLLRRTQTLNVLRSGHQAPERWAAEALNILEDNREMVLLEWRQPQFGVLSQRVSPFHGRGQLERTRNERLQDIVSACNNAQRSSAPAYSGSYFLSDSGGLGQELMEMCLPQVVQGELTGYVVVTYSLQGILAEMLDRSDVRGRSVALTEGDGTRLAISGMRPPGDVVTAQHLLELPGNLMMLRLESPRDRFDTASWGALGLVGTMSALLLLVMGLLGRDMRLRLKAETELAEALAFRKAMENSLVTGLRARDMDGRITYVNPAFCEMVGLSAQQLLGQGQPAAYWPPEMVDEYQRRQAVRLAGQTLPTEGFEAVFMRPDGSRFPVLIIEAPLINMQGQQTGWMSAILDLTEQRRVEALSQASQERLQATARLATVGEMASLLSHELNQPLSAIASYATGSLNLLQDHPPAPDSALQDVAQALGRIQAQADRAARVIRSVADFVRRREQTRELAREPVTAHALFQAISPLVNLQAGREHIQVVMHVDADCPPALCDRTMIEQVLLNLARNGMQAMPTGHPAERSGLRVLTLQARSLAAQGTRAWLAFSVTDHGAGLTPEVAERLFTPFFTTKAEGMGLGLSLCRTVVEQHGGALTHMPAQPCGTVFMFTLPAAPTPQ